MHLKTKLYERLRERIEQIPVIDCHDHTTGVKGAPQWKEPIQSLIAGYFPADLISAGGERSLQLLRDPEISTEEKWPTFEKIWTRTEFTSYARVPKLILKRFYDEEKMTLEALLRIKDKLVQPTNETFYYDTLKKAGIRCRLVNICIDLKEYIEGRLTLPDVDRMLVPLPAFHSIRDFNSIHAITSIVGEHVTSLDEYLNCCQTIFEKMKARGTIGMKDQSAYSRTIRFDPATRSEAEALFNKIISNPRNALGWPEAKPLDDYLFHYYTKQVTNVLPEDKHQEAFKEDFYKEIKSRAKTTFFNIIKTRRAVSLSELL